MLEQYETAGPGTLNPLLAAVVLQVRARLLQLKGGLDFLGVATNLVPIWSFQYLQNVARYFTQQAIQAERDFVNFQDRGENEALTRQQLEQSVSLAKAEQELAKKQREAAESEAAAYTTGVELAKLRADNAQANHDAYSSMSWERIWLDQANAWYSSQNPWELEHAIPGDGRHIHEVISENTVQRGKLVRDYELGAMQRQTDEMKKAGEVAKQQLEAANARVAAAKQMEAVALLRTQAAQENCAAFDSQFFTPDVWQQMASVMRNISSSYLYMSLRVARMMQRAYNFENDVDQHFIRSDYSASTIKGLLAADALLLDIDAFTYDLVTSVQRKEMPVKQTVSLGERYPFLFETAFRQTGRLAFETRLEDFEFTHPGSYGQRIEQVEVEIEGVLPASGIRGTLTNSGISTYRTSANELKYRIQNNETLVLSDYRVKADALVFRSEGNQLGIFEGAGTASSWELEIPPATNDLDYRWVTDIRLTFYYRARYDRTLAQAVKAQLAAYAGNASQSRSLALRWMYPDLFFHFQDTGVLAFILDHSDFPLHHRDPQLNHVALVLTTNPGIEASSWMVRLGVPSHPETIAAQPTAKGELVAKPGQPWAPLATGQALGEYRIELRGEENPALVQDGVLNLEPIRNIVVILEYTFTPRS